MSDEDRLILVAATQTRRLADTELRQVVRHAAQAGFDPAPTSNARGLSGLSWRGRVLRGSDRIASGERHYLRHVVRMQEWPPDTSLDDYYRSIRNVIEDEASGIFTSRYQGQYQIGFIGRSGACRGPGGFRLILVEYRVGVEHWTTAYQPQEGFRVLRDPQREHVTWLRRFRL